MTRARRGRRPPRRPLRRGRPGAPPPRRSPSSSGRVPQPPPSGRVRRPSGRVPPGSHDARPPSGRFAPRGNAPQRPRSSESGSFRARSPKAFEIRRGRSSSDSEEEVENDSSGEIPISHVVLPQSITQEAEEDSLKRRFGTEGLPSFLPRDDRVQLRESGGAHGPDRYMRRRVLYVLLLLLIVAGAGAAYVYTNPELRKQILGE